MSMDSHGGMILTGETKVLVENIVKVLLYPSQISHGLTLSRTQVSSIRHRWLRSWARSLRTGVVDLRVHAASKSRTTSWSSPPWGLLVLYGAFSVTRLYSADGRVISERWWIGNDFVGSSRGLNLRYFPGIRLEGLRKSTKNLYQDSLSSGLRFENGTKC
jgi:hypothetical protein